MEVPRAGFEQVWPREIGAWGWALDLIRSYKVFFYNFALLHKLQTG